MAQNIVASTGNTSFSPEFMRSTRGWEMVKLVGTATASADTSNAYQCQSVQKPAVVIGWPGSFAVSGSTITFTSLFALGSNTIYVLVAEAL